MPEPTSEPPTTSAGPVGRAAHRRAQRDRGGARARRRVDVGGGGAAGRLRRRRRVDQRPRRVGHAAPVDHDDRPGRHRPGPPRHRVGPGRPRGAGRALLLAAGGVATLAVAALPLPSRTEFVGRPHRRRHAVVRAARGVAVVRGPAGRARWRCCTAWPGRRPSCSPWPSPRSGSAWAAATFGVHERVVAFLTVVWPLVTAISTWWWAGHRIGSRRVRHVLAVVGLIVACAARGHRRRRPSPRPPPRPGTTRPAWRSTRTRCAAASSSRPRRSATCGWSSRASPPASAPCRRSRPTSPRCSPGPGVSLATLRPGPEELSAAIRDVAVAVMLRFTLGALAVVAVVLAGYAVLRRRRPPVALVVAGLVGWLASTAVTGLLALRDLPARPPGDVHLDRGARHAAAQPGHPQRRRDPGQPGGALPAQPHRPVDGAAAEVRRRRRWSPTPRCACCSSATSTPATSTT